MKKIRLSVGVLAFMGLAVLNFTQSERCLIGNSKAQVSNPISTLFSGAISYVSSYFYDKHYDCSTMDCPYHPVDKYGNIIPYITFPGEIGCCVSGNTQTAFTCLSCKPIFCSPK